MKIKDGFILRKMNNMNIVVAVGKAVKSFNGYITLNETGTFFWEKLASGTTKEDLIKSVLAEYDVDEETARNDVELFIDNLTKNGLIEE